MKLLDAFKKDKVTVIALHRVLMNIAADNGLTLDELLEKEPALMEGTLKQLEKAMTDIDLTAAAPPLQPTADSREMKELRLIKQVMLYRLNHPDAMVIRFNGRITYSDGFIHFILQRLDWWEYSQEAFCEQVKVPYQTLCAWIEKENYR